LNAERVRIPGTMILPVNWAAEKAHENVVELLLRKGADTEIPNLYNRTPLTKAIENNSDKIVRLLLTAGAKVNYVYRNFVPSFILFLGEDPKLIFSWFVASKQFYIVF
jgi:ankyrin repeat protein